MFQFTDITLEFAFKKISYALKVSNLFHRWKSHLSSEDNQVALNKQATLQDEGTLLGLYNL